MADADQAIINPNCISKFLELREKRYRYIIYKLDDTSNEIVVEKTADPIVTEYNDFIVDLPRDEPRWAVYDFGRDLCFYYW